MLVCWGTAWIGALGYSLCLCVAGQSVLGDNLGWGTENVGGQSVLGDDVCWCVGGQSGLVC